MSNFVPEKVFLRGILLHYFNMKKTAAESHRILVEVYGEHALAERTCQKWFARFKSGDFGLKDEERPGQPKTDPFYTAFAAVAFISGIFFGIWQARISKRL